MMLFSGGDRGSQAITDTHTYTYSSATHTWSQLNVRGSIPAPRHGHVMLCANNKVRTQPHACTLDKSGKEEPIAENWLPEGGKTEINFTKQMLSQSC